MKPQINKLGTAIVIFSVFCMTNVVDADAKDGFLRKFIPKKLRSNDGKTHKIAGPRQTGYLNRTARIHTAPPPPRSGHEAYIFAVRKRAEGLARGRLSYVFGGSSPAEGGMDCSGTVKHVLSSVGIQNVPRTSFQQYEWLKSGRKMTHTKTIPASMGGRNGLKPGDLIFWGGTYNSGHKVSHVMIYLGQGPDGQHYMFGARSRGKTGMNGSGVDIFKLSSGFQKGLIGYGTVPGVL